jgi:phosphatidylserine/phosphatidylglycerophosphate/cardiolipin synthase-like enzyme
VWTGPTSPFVSARRTEQALLQVIESSREALFITSFVAYDVSSIVKALNSSISRGVKVLMLLESSSEYGGSVSIDVIGKMKDLVPKATIFAWSNKSPAFFGGRVHAKIALADNKMCFITSANLTGFAMEKNMEAGVLINGGRLPIILQRHLQSLITLKLIDHV